jgi:hypothetical protein
MIESWWLYKKMVRPEKTHTCSLSLAEDALYHFGFLDTWKAISRCDYQLCLSTSVSPNKSLFFVIYLICGIQL